MNRLSHLMVIFFTVFFISETYSQNWFTENFPENKFEPGWLIASGDWRVENGIAKIDTKDYDQLLASDFYINNLVPYFFELQLKGIRSGVYFSLNERKSKNLSHMVRFDENSILTGYFNANGEYNCTNTFDLSDSPDKNNILKIFVDPIEKKYDIYVNDKLIGTDHNLVFTSGYIGLQASDGKNEFCRIRVFSNQKPQKLERPVIGRRVTFQHINWIKADGKNIVFYNPEINCIQTVNSEGKLICQKTLEKEPIKSSFLKNNIEYTIINKKILVSDFNSGKKDTISERLVFPVSILVDDEFNVYVSDAGANTLHKYNKTGKYLKSFSASFIGGFKAPGGLDFYGDSGIIVADYDRIVFLNKNFEEITPKINFPKPTEAVIQWKGQPVQKPGVEYSDDGKIWKKAEGKILTGKKNIQVVIKNLKPLTRYTYKIRPVAKTLPATSTYSNEFRFYTPPKEPRKMAYCRLPILVMVYKNINYRDRYPKDKYPNIPDGKTLSDEEIEYIRDAAKFNSEFYFRNSSCRAFLDFTVYIVNEPLFLSEVGEKDPYWLPPNERVTRDYEKAVRELNCTPEYFCGLIIPYAWQNYPERRSSVMSDPSKADSINIRQAYGGAAMGVPAPWKYGKTAGYTGNPFQDRFSRQDWLITHEFHHQIDALMAYSGFSDYYHSDIPWKMPGRFGEDFDFNAHIIRNANFNWWLNLKFGELKETVDNDSDGVPDDDPSLPFDEKRLGGNPDSKDSDGDGLADLNEVLAGTSMGTALDNIDTDGDGLNDKEDPEPLYPISTILKKSQNDILWNPFGYQKIKNYQTKFSLAWDDTFLYLKCSLSKPATILFQIDANSDGWFHGFDNYQIRIKSFGDSAKIEDFYLRDCSSWSEVPKDIKNILRFEDLKLNVMKGVSTSSSILVASIPWNEKYGFSPFPGKKMGLRLCSQVTEDRWVWEELFERNYMFEVELQ